ncbi:nematocyst expressed protein 6 [Exaiptasia diaphana]|uniref:Metalloendopeptidase n=1 Tax=Exaiptasia diaphana TaxID=2652724 RepID=A0A913XBT9_EXADI|nr:nematocyst expressed protein 6 [Exaiptasia diaphana]
MLLLIAFTFLEISLTTIQGKPVDSRLELVENDMLITNDQKQVYNQLKDGRVRRAAIKDKWLWPGGKVPYTFGKNLNDVGKRIAKQAMQHWMDRTCVKFIERSNQKNYLEFTYDGGCKAQVGYRKEPKQLISIGSSDQSSYSPCTLGSTIHELGHSIGFFHEHTRPDRDKFVRVIESNVRKEAAFDFEKVSTAFLDSRGNDYDYGSIMHYSRYQGNNAYGAVTLEPLVPNTDIGQRIALSQGDIDQTNKMYQCDAQGESHFTYNGDKDEDKTIDYGNIKGPKPGDILD